LRALLREQLLSTILPQLLPAAATGRGPAKSFFNYSTILPRLEEFGESGLAWSRIVEEIIVEELSKHLVNSAQFTQQGRHHYSVRTGSS
jgi:hypothetical protein